MLIGIDGNEANIEQRVGVNEYGFQLLKALYKIANKEKKYRFRVYLNQEPKKHLPKASSFWQYMVLPGKGVWIIRKLMPALYKEEEKPDIFFSPSHYIPLFAPMPRVCAIMDLGYLVSSGQFKAYDFWQLKLWSAYSIFVSKRIIAISKSTKKDIVRQYKINPDKIDVTYLGYDSANLNVKDSKNDVRRITSKYKSGSKYILFISTLKPSKNIEGLLEAWSYLEEEYSDTKLIIAGKKGWLFETIFKKAQELQIEDRVVFTDYIPEEDKLPLIAGAKIFVLPSFWEGFGLDVVTSMIHGVPAVVSDVGSLPEVAGEAGIFVDPENPKSIAKGIKKVLSMDKKEYQRLSKKSIKQAQKFSWDKTASETIDVLEKAINLKI